MTMYLHILDRAGKTHAVLNTRQKLSLLEVADLAYLIQNPNYTQGGSVSEFQGVGVLSTFKDLNKITRFASGQIQTEHIPRQLRGEALLSFLNKMTKLDAPLDRAINLTSWTTATRPIKTTSVTQQQLTQATSLKGQGVSHRKIASITGIPYGSISKLFAGGSYTPINAI